MIAPASSPSSALLQLPASARTPTRPRSARLLPRVRVRVAPPTATKDDGKEFMESPVGKFVSQLTEMVRNSPINEGKIWLAKAQAGSYDEAEIRQKMSTLQSDNPVVMYSFSTCPFCKLAKSVLDDEGAQYVALELNEMGQEGMAMRAELAKDTGRTSMPNIFIQGKSYGGCNDGPGVMTLQQEGKLVPLLKEAGAL